MLKYVQNKDVFMRYHKAHLTRRLILDTSADSEKEENMVEWLRVCLFHCRKKEKQKCTYLKLKWRNYEISFQYNFRFVQLAKNLICLSDVACQMQNNLDLVLCGTSGGILLTCNTLVVSILSTLNDGSHIKCNVNQTINLINSSHKFILYFVCCICRKSVCLQIMLIN